VADASQLPYWPDMAEAQAAGPAPADGPHPMPAIPCGLYEVDEPGGSTVYVRVRRRADRSKFAPGQWVAEWLIGHDDRTWEAFAFLTNKSIDVWKRFRGTDYDTVGTLLFKHFDGGECFDGWAFRLAEARCARCGRLLSDRDRKAGIGASCAGRWNL
jgi:hypothetical protein